MTKVWTQDLIFEFIELYQKERILWDSKHPFHKQRYEIREAWNRIQANLSETLPVKELKRKKESLMTSFRARIRKKKKTRGEYRPQWFAFPIMYSFLGNLEKFELESLNTSTSQDTDHDYLEYLGDEDRKPAVEYVPLEPSTTTTDKQYVIFNSGTPNLKRQHVNTSYESARTFDQSKTDEAPSAEGMDECDLFANLLAKKLRRLDEEQRDMAMHAIDNIMFQAKSTMRNKLAKTSRQRETTSPMYIFSQDNEVLKCYEESDPMEDGIETIETLDECDDDDDDD